MIDHATLKLGQYVVPRGPRKDGTYRVFFEVPKRLRPSDWPATIPLPHTGRTGNLRDDAECERIRSGARELLRALKERRAGRPPERSESKTWETLFGLWHRSVRFNFNNKPVTQEGYLSRSRTLMRKVLPAFPEYTPVTLLESQAEEILNSVQSPDVRRIYLSVFNVLMAKAIKERWRDDNPFKDIRYPTPERTINLWTEDDVQTIGSASIEAGQPGVGGIVWTDWLIGQRLTDVRMFRDNAEYADGVFRFFQSKTGKYVTIPAPDELRCLIERGGEPGGYLFLDSNTERPFTMQGLSNVFKKIRNPLDGQLGKHLLMKHLRHSCVYQFALAGCDIYEIASVTGHAYQSVHTILEHYLPRDNLLAFRAMEKRAALASGRTITFESVPRAPLRAGVRREAFPSSRGAAGPGFQLARARRGTK